MGVMAALRQLLADLRRQRARTILTVLGITWGTTAVVTLLAFGVGMEDQMRTNARGMGDGIALVFGGQTTLPFRGFPEGRPIRLVEEDADLVMREVPEVGLATPEYGTWAYQVRRSDKRTGVFLTGVRADYGQIRNVFPRDGGRFLSERDVGAQRRVIVLGGEVKRLLFGEEDAVGQQVMLGQSPFTVVGIMADKTQNSSYNARDEDRVFIPITTYRAMVGSRFINTLLYAPTDPERYTAASEAVRRVLGRKYVFDPADQDAVGIWDTNEMFMMFKYLFLGFNIFLGIVGSFTLVVGGVGVANIMFVVVQERTREIGIRRSVGARRRDILTQVLLEAVLVVALGAVVGFALSVGIARLMGLLPIQEFVGVPTISPMVAILTGVLLTVVALSAGLLPARKAARIEPADAIRWG